jgi:tRNA A37 methylthiotransferase MiaB
MVQPIRIFLGDLTYNTVGMSTEVFPLNVGYIAAHCKKRFGSKIDITLFKYIDKLEKSIYENPPDVLGLSNYVWSYRIGLEMFDLVRSQNPDVITVWGGPNFPQDLESQQSFMKKCSNVDFYVPIEGEIGFSNIIEEVLNISKPNYKKEILLKKPIDGCISRNPDGSLQFSIPQLRTKELDEIPSPYLTGLMDEFFDGKLTPMIQTNRGCPFTCTFCVDGADTVNRVNQFGLGRVSSELNYIGEHVTSNIHSLHISDLNFGMYPRDLEICDGIVDIQKKYDYPHRVLSTTGKNKKERIIQAIEKLNGTMSLTMSVQSMDEQILRNIRRSNISVDHMLALEPTIKKVGLVTESEVILALPGETYQTQISTLKKLLSAKLDYIQVYTCMLINGSELNTPEQRKKWNFKTKFRILPRDFTTLRNGKNVIETEEVIVGSDTLSFEEYLELRSLSFSIFVTNIGIIYDSLLKFLRQNNIEIFDLFFQMMKQIDSAPPLVQKIFDSVKNDMVDELWDSPEDIQAHYQEQEEYEKLLSGEAARNVMQYHSALVRYSCMDEWTQFAGNIVFGLMKRKKISYELENQLRNIINYCAGLGHNTLGDDRMSTNPEFLFDYDIENWLTDKNNKTLNQFKLDKKRTISFQFSKSESKVIQDELDRQNTDIGRSQALKRLPMQIQFRKPKALSQNL